MARHEHHLMQLALLAGGAGVAWYGYQRGWFANLVGAAPAPAAAGGSSSPPAAAALLTPPASITPAPAPVVTYVPQPQPYVIPTPAAPVTYTATTGGPSAPQPSNFSVQYDPKTGLELPYAPPGVLLPAQTICDAIFPNNNPTGVYGPSKQYPHLIDALADQLEWFKNWSGGPTQPVSYLAAAFTGGTGANPDAAMALQRLFASHFGWTPDQVIDLTRPANMVNIMRVVTAYLYGDDKFSAVPDSCFVAAYNEVFSPPITSL